MGTYVNEYVVSAVCHIFQCISFFVSYDTTSIVGLGSVQCKIVLNMCSLI